MIDFDLIQQTVTETIDWRRPFWFTMILFATGALIIVMTIGSLMRMIQTVEGERARQDNRGEPYSSPDEYPFSKVIWLMVIGVILGPVTVHLFDGPAALALGSQALVLLVAAGFVHIGLRRLKDAEKALTRNENDGYIIAPRRKGRFWVARDTGQALQTTQGVGLVLLTAVLGCLLGGVVEDVPVTKTEPTAVARALSTVSYNQVVKAVTDGYDVEVASKSGCDSTPAKIPDEVDAGSYGDTDEAIEKHYDRVQFLKKAVSSDFTSNPQLLLKTPNGVVTCYKVQYDQTDGTATLLVSDENIDAVAPGSLKKD